MFKVISNACLALMLLTGLVHSDFAQTPRPVTVSDVIAMLDAKVPDSVIVARVQGNQTAPNVSTDDLVQLKKAGASEAIMLALMSPTGATSNGATSSGMLRTIKIQDGTPVRLVVMDEITSATAKPNDVVRFELTEDIKVGDAVAIQKGSIATGHILISEPKGRLGKAGKLEFSVDYLKAPDESNVRLRATTGHSDNRAITGAMMLGVTGLFIKGKDVTFPKGTSINAFVDGDKEVKLK